ncbi:MAG: UDP-3-O-(3-hydroxymyristoyl)glucosamine N-acyltransferase [Candidatus Omnitrophica bacterium]|nr:UDP-3-O-(3-hydroxymyristoyl)glucosamine N-acyltransferase [Candidatus Omnitrophota bacterium]
MRKTLKEIAQLLDGEIDGDPNLVVTGLSGIKEAKKGDLTFLANSKYLSLVNQTQATAILISPDVKVKGVASIKTTDPSFAFAKVAELMNEKMIPSFLGIHEKAHIAQGAQIGRETNIGPFAVVEAGAQIGDRTTIHSGCYIGSQTVIGEDCLVYSNVSIREKVQIGHRVIIHSGTVIGSDGFGFVDVKGAHHKIPQIGIVVIEDDVEIGANVTIDRARFEKTVIGRGTKIDNLVQIAHNVKVGQNCIIAAQAGVAGSSVIEDGVTLAGQVGVAGHLTIGKGAIVGGQAGVTSSVDPYTVVSGYPAKPHAHAKRVNACLQKLPEYVKTIKELEKKIEKLEQGKKTRRKNE